MNSEDNLSFIPHELQSLPWIKQLILLLQEQARQIDVIRGILPPEIQGSHFGYQLRALLHNLYALGMTEPGLFDLLRGSGIEVSEGQVHSESAGYQQAAEGILTAGIEEAPYIRTDDTGANINTRIIIART